MYRGLGFESPARYAIDAQEDILQGDRLTKEGKGVRRAGARGGGGDVGSFFPRVAPTRSEAWGRELVSQRAQAFASTPTIGAEFGGAARVPAIEFKSKCT